jgi:hypothetical protein
VGGSHETSGVEANELGSVVKCGINEAVEKLRTDTKRTSLWSYIHTFDLGGTIGKPAERTDADGAAASAGEQKTTCWRSVDIQLLANLRRACGRLAYAVVLIELLRSPGEVSGHQLRRRILVGSGPGFPNLNLESVHRAVLRLSRPRNKCRGDALHRDGG